MFDGKQPVTQALMDRCYSFIVVFAGALLSNQVLCFLCETEQGNCLCSLAEFTGSCVPDFWYLWLFLYTETVVKSTLVENRSVPQCFKFIPLPLFMMEIPSMRGEWAEMGVYLGLVIY